MNIRLLLFALWLPQAIWQVFLWLHWWQVKEYRFDRFKVLLRQKSGRKKLKIALLGTKLFILSFSPDVLLPLLFLGGLDLYALYSAVRRSMRKPVITDRVKRILLVTFGGVGVLMALYLSGIFRFEIALLYSELFLILGPMLGIFWTKPIADSYKEREKKLAEQKLAGINPTVIGITGSYGKSTTKEFLSHLLSAKYVTEKTNKNENNDFGVARKILGDFNEKATYFVAEMGAYTRGEIKSIAGFTHPTSGIITGLEPQHLELFGSFEKIMDAKFELIKALPEGGSAYFNVSNKDCEKLAKRAEKLPTNITVYRYKLVTKFIKSPTISAQSKITKFSTDTISFVIKIGNERHSLVAPVTGGHFIENLTGAILVARNNGVSWAQIEKQVKTITVPLHTMRTSVLNSGLTVIDDSGNSTPRGFNAALNFLDTFQKHRVVIASGIIELGTYSHVIHQDIAKLARSRADAIVLTSADYQSDFLKGLGGEEKLLIIEDARKLVTFVQSLDPNRTVVLLEGKLPSTLMQYFEENKL